MHTECATVAVHTLNFRYWVQTLTENSAPKNENSVPADKIIFELFKSEIVFEFILKVICVCISRIQSGKLNITFFLWPIQITRQLVAFFFFFILGEPEMLRFLPFQKIS